MLCPAVFLFEHKKSLIGHGNPSDNLWSICICDSGWEYKATFALLTDELMYLTP